MTAFSLADRLLVRGPAHVEEADRLVRLYARIATVADEEMSSWIPYPTYGQLRDGMGSFEEVGAYRVQEALIGRGPESRRARVGQTTGAFFPLLGVRPVIGRFFTTAEDAATSGPLAILSEQMWRTDFAGDRAVLGRSIVVRDEPHTIVGIAPEGFSGTDVRRVDVWALANSRTAGTVNWHTVGRLKPGVSVEAVTADAAAVHARTRAAGPRWMREAALLAAPIRYDESGQERLEATMARWLAGVSMLILLITSANVVNLLLVRIARHRRELAIRVTLGSGLRRVIRLLALEGALLALASGVVSLGVARVAEPLIRTALFADEAAWTFSLVDVRVLATLLMVMTLIGLIVGIVPAVQASNLRLTEALKGGAQGGESSSHTRSALTVLQAALSVVLLAGAGFFVRSMQHVRALDLGADADRVIVVTAQLPEFVALSRAGMRDGPAIERDAYRRFLQSVVRLPGVEHASITVGQPFDGGSFAAGVWVPGMDSVPVVDFQGPYVSAVASDYFITMGTRIVRGRAFTDQDREGTEPVVIVGETMARALWPGRNAIGGCMRIAFATATCARVVGIAADVHRVGLREARSMQYYVPLGQLSIFAGAALVVRPNASSPVSWPALRKAILDVEPSVRSIDVERLDARLEGEMRPLRLGMATFGLSGAIALLVAILGLYSLMSYMVAWRTREIGVRLALGATGPQLTHFVVGRGTALAALGVVFGLAITFAGSRWLEPHLFDTSVFDPAVVAAVTVVLLAVAVIAGWLPARRAIRISPAEALRSE